MTLFYFGFECSLVMLLLRDWKGQLHLLDRRTHLITWRKSKTSRRNALTQNLAFSNFWVGKYVFLFLSSIFRLC